MSNSTNNKIPQYRINVLMLNSKLTLQQNNNLYIPVSIDKEQSGTQNLYAGKIIYLFINSVTVKTIYHIKPDGTEYLKIDNYAIYDTIDFVNGNIFQYNEIDIVADDYGMVTLSDIKLKLKATKNGTYNGVSGLLEPIHLKALEEIKYFREISTKTINNLVNGVSILFVEKLVTENSFSLSFNLQHVQLDLEYDIKVFGNNYIIKTNKFGSSNNLSNLNLELSINKVLSNDGTKHLFQIFCKFLNIPGSLINNPDLVSIRYSEDIINKNVTSNSPSNYILSNYVAIVSPKLFNRNILFHDINGPVSVNVNESIKLLGSDNLLNINNLGWYHYDNYLANDAILTGLPTGIKNVFTLNLRRLTTDIVVQYLYILDSVKNEIKTFSRFKNYVTNTTSAWIEYVTSSHKHLAADITTNETRNFVTQEQITLWNSFAASVTNYWNQAVLNVADLPKPALNGECRYVISINQIYTYVANDNNWISVTKVKLDYEITTDTLKIKVNNGGTDQIITLPEVSENNPGIVSSAVISDYKGYFETKLNFTTENAGSGVPTTYEQPLNYTINIYEADTDMIIDGTSNYIFGLNGETRIIDLSIIANKIKKTLYTKTDTNNIFAGVVKDYQFHLVTNTYITQKLIFGTGKTVNILENGILIPHTENEFILSQSKNYLIKINESNIKIYSINKQ